MSLGGAAEQIEVRPLAAVRASRGTHRLFFVLPVETHRAGPKAHWLDLVRSPWSKELTVYWANAIEP